MNVEQIMKLVDAYASEAWNHGLYGGIHWHKQQIAARAVVVAALEKMTKAALEQAAQECEAYLHRDYAGAVLEYGPDVPANRQIINCPYAVRKMKEQV